MPDKLYALFMIGVMSLCTVLLRFLPFWVFRGKRRVPPLIRYLGQVLPAAIMAMLVIYCLKDISFAAFSAWLPALIAVTVVVLLHVWKRTTLMSIIGGTACYMILIHLMG